MRLDSLISQLPPAERVAMVHDGEIFGLIDAEFPIDTVTTPQQKAHAVCHPAPSALIASGWSALWVAGCAGAPTRPEATMRARRRPNHVTENSRSVRETAHHPDDIINFPAGAAFTVERALVDILKSDPRNDNDLAPAIARVLYVSGVTVETLAARLNREKSSPFCRIALRRLAFVDAVNVVDTINATNRVEHALKVTSVTRLEDKAAQRQAF